MTSAALAPECSGPHDVVIRCEAVSKRFGKTLVLADLSLSVRHGEVVCIVGPSGGGKSTFLRTINGLEGIDSGRIVVNRCSLPGSAADIRAVRREVGMVFQNFNLFPHISVRRNVTLAPRRCRRLSRAEADARCQALLARVRIADQIDKYPSQLSGGQQQRVAIARALAMEPRILLFDEPTSSLDPEMVSEVLDVIRELAGTGITLLIVTHEMGFARQVAHRMLFMEGGRIICDEPPDRFFASTDPRVGAFLSKIL